MNCEKPALKDYIISAIKRLRRKKLPSSVRVEKIWAVVQCAGYSAAEYKLTLITLLNDETLFCHGVVSDYSLTREQRITREIASRFSFKKAAEHDFRFIRVTIMSDGLTKEGTRALIASKGGHSFSVSQELLNIKTE